MYSKLKEKNKAEKGEIKRRVKRSKNDYEQTENIQAELLKKDKRTGENKSYQFSCTNRTAAKAQALTVSDIPSILTPNAFHMLKDVSLRFPFTHME